MKIYRLFFFLLSIGLIVSCAQPKDDNKKGSGTDEVIITDSNETAFESEYEEFDQFLKKFSDSESFQLKRVKFPINVIVPDMTHEGMAPVEENIGRYDWEILDLNYDSTYLTRPYDQYYQVVRMKNDTAVVEIRGINNGIYADYYFALVDKEWYLVTLYEASF